MTNQTIPAVYEAGVLRPLAPLDLPEHQRVRVTIQLDESPASDALQGWATVLAGLSDEERRAVHEIALERATFREPPTP